MALDARREIRLLGDFTRLLGPAERGRFVRRGNRGHQMAPGGPHQHGQLRHGNHAHRAQRTYLGSITCNPLTREKYRLLNVATWLPRFEGDRRHDQVVRIDLFADRLQVCPDARVFIGRLLRVGTTSHARTYLDR